MFTEADAVTYDVLDEVAKERNAQDARFGEQNHPDGNDFDGSLMFVSEANHYKRRNAEDTENGTNNWTNILLEEVYEALAESDTAKLRAELVQVAAVAVNWIEAIDRRLAETEADLAASPWPGTEESA